MRGHSSKNNTLNSAARRRMEDRLFSRKDSVRYLKRVKREHVKLDHDQSVRKDPG